MTREPSRFSPAQQFGLVLLRTLIGWHFLYEGYFKLMLPGWTPDGSPLARWSSAGYLKAATGPFASMFHSMAESSWLPTLDLLVAGALLLVGLSLVLGLFTEAGCVGALGLLALFYVSAIPTSGLPAPHAEGTYLLVNKNLVEAGAVFVLLAFRTGRIAGLDLLRHKSPAPTPSAEEALE
jgi:thiosulfate dehydrogenase [quinone] large subunit